MDKQRWQEEIMNRMGDHMGLCLRIYRERRRPANKGRSELIRVLKRHERIAYHALSLMVPRSWVRQQLLGTGTRLPTPEDSH